MFDRLWERTFPDITFVERKLIQLKQKWKLVEFVCVHVCNSLPWIHIKYEQVKIKYSASLEEKKKNKSHISRQCVHVNYAGEAAGK